MGDDFDLFPKRENLDPFSFGRQDKKAEREEEVGDLFGQEEDITIEPPLSPEDPETGGPTPAEKTFDEPVREVVPAREKPVMARTKASSPFVLIGGALIIILGLIYLALTFLIPDVPPAPTVVPPPVTVQVEPPAQALLPSPEPEEAVSPAAQEPAPAPEAVASPAQAPEKQAPSPPAPEPAAAEAVKKTSTKAAPAPAAKPQAGEGRFSVQLGALILEPSIRELEKRVAGLGYETFRKTGTTTRMMNIVTAGPFGSMEEGGKALSRIRASGVDSTLTRRSNGEVVVNAGSFLLEKNADIASKKVRDLGYPVIRERKEAKLPVTFVRTGHFAEAGEAGRVRDELKGKGLDALVVESP